MRRALLIACLALLLATPAAPAATRVLIISVDGARPDLLLRAEAPAVRGLMARGAFSLWAETTEMGNTLPSHVSMLTGVTIARHGIAFNDERAVTRPIHPQATTLFELARAAGLSSALVAGKSKFAALNKPGTIDHVVIPEDAVGGDADVIEAAIALLRERRPRLMVVHLPTVDSVGHRDGWGSPAHIAAIEEADRGLARLLQTLDDLGLSGETLVLLSADHGGSGRSHGAGDPRSLYIPWIAAGPGVRRGFDLNLLRGLTVRTYDTFATAADALGLPLPQGIDGRVVREIYADVELLAPAPSTAPAKAR